MRKKKIIDLDEDKDWLQFIAEEIEKVAQNTKEIKDKISDRRNATFKTASDFIVEIVGKLPPQGRDEILRSIRAHKLLYPPMAPFFDDLIQRIETMQPVSTVQPVN